MWLYTQRSVSGTSALWHIRLLADLQASRAGSHSSQTAARNASLFPCSLHLIGKGAAPGAVTDMLRPAVKPLFATYQHNPLWKVSIIPCHFQPLLHVHHALTVFHLYFFMFCLSRLFQQISVEGHTFVCLNPKSFEFIVVLQLTEYICDIQKKIILCISMVRIRLNNIK